tara:strand:- start:3531 stop:6167 length:2637 start_codon:yes stop_codon:yes gene_type:complete
MPLYEFTPSFTVDQTDLSLTATGSGVHLNKVVNVNLGILDRISGGIGDNRDFLANPYVNNVSLDILNIDGTVKFQDFLTNYKSNAFSITEYDNINVFGEYTKDFGVKATVSESSQTNTSEFYFYGNVPEFSGITVRDSTGTTSHSSSASSKTAVNASGQTGLLTSTVTFNNNSNYISFDRLEIYSSTGSAAFNSQIDPNPVFSRNLSNETIQSFDINEGELPNESAVYLHFVPYGQLGTGEAWSIGPYTFKDNPPAANPYITEVTSGDITGALGFTPISSETDDQTLSEVLANGNSADLGFTVGSSEITGDLTVGGDIITSGATAIGSGGHPLNLKGNFVTLQYAAVSSSTPETFLQISSSEQVEFYREANLTSGASIPAGQNITLGNAVIQADTSASKSAINYAADNIAFSVSGTIDASSSEFDQSNEINSFASAILLGTKNKIFGDFSTILAGSENIISGEESTSNTSLNSDFDFIGAGSGNQITGSRFSSIVGGIGNKIFKTSNNSFIGGGTGNVLEGSPNSVIGGGINNYINSAESVQVFGSYITGTSVYDGYIYLADNQNRTKTPNASDTLFIDFEGGVDIKTGDLTVEGNITMGGSNVLTAVRTVTAGGNTLGAGETLAFGVGGDNIKVTESAGAVTIAVDGSAELPTATIPNLAASKITSSTFADARISESSVTQHEAALTLVSGQITGALGYTPLSGALSSVRTVTAGGNTLGTSETLAFTAGSGIQITESAGAVTIASPSGVASDDVNFIVKLTQSEYDAITPDSNTLYFISDESTNSPVVNPIKTVTSNYTITDTDHTVLVSGSASTNITLPSAVNNSNYVYNIKNITTGAVAISGTVGLIDLTGSLIINSKFESVTVQSDGSNWYII